MSEQFRKDPKSGAYIFHQSKCIHQHSDPNGHTTCTAGICYNHISLIPEMRPCYRCNWNPKNRKGKPLRKCPKHQWATPAQSREYEKQFQATKPENKIDRRTRKHRHLRIKNMNQQP